MPSRIQAAASVNFAERISCQPSNNQDRPASSNADSLPMHFSLDFFFPHDGYKMPSNRTPEAKYDHLSDSESDDASSFLKLRSTSHHWGQSRGLVVGLCGIIAALLTALFVMVWQHMASPSQLQCAKLNSPFCRSFASQKMITVFSLSIETDMGAPPAWDGVEFCEGDFENEFPHKTLYRGPPTPERQKAWEDLWLRERRRSRQSGKRRAADLHQTHRS